MFGQTGPPIQATGQIISNMGTVNKRGEMVENTLVSGNKARWMEKGKLTTKTEEFMRVNSKLI